MEITILGRHKEFGNHLKITEDCIKDEAVPWMMNTVAKRDHLFSDNDLHLLYQFGQQLVEALSPDEQNTPSDR